MTAKQRSAPEPPPERGRAVVHSIRIPREIYDRLLAMQGRLDAHLDQHAILGRKVSVSQAAVTAMARGLDVLEHEFPEPRKAASSR